MTNTRNVMDVMAILKQRAHDSSLPVSVRNAYIQSYNLLVYAMKNDTEKIAEAMKK